MANGSGKDPSTGRFIAGNRCGRGNPFGRQVNKLRQALLHLISDDEFAAIVRKLVDAAKAGEPWAVIEVLNRTVGRPLSGSTATALDGELSEEVTDLSRLTLEEVQALSRILRKLHPPGEESVE
jgi:hypothetical protein